MPRGVGPGPSGSSLATPPPVGSPPPRGRGLGPPAPAPAQTEASWEDVIRSIAQQEGVDPDLALSVSGVESSYNPASVSPKGARGLFQLMPETAKELGVDPDDPVQNIQGGLRYLKKQLADHDGDLQTALYAYNAGPGNVAKGIIPEESKAYATAVQSRYMRALQAGGGVTRPQDDPAMQNHAPGTDPLLGALQGVASFGESMVKAHNPYTPQGRVNIAGTIGAGVAGLATGGAGLVVRAAAPILGAALGSGGTQALENAAGTSTEDPLTAGLISGGSEAVGGAIAWPIRAVAKRLAAPGVARAAKASVDVGVDTARVLGRDAVDAAKTTGARKLAGLDLAHAAELDTLKAQLDRLPVTPTLQVGEDAAAVLTGPAARARDLAGQRVAAAAESGPALDLTAVQDKLSGMVRTSMPASIWGGVEEAADSIGFVGQIPAAGPSRVAAQASAGGGQSIEQGIQRALNLPADHPLPGVLGRVQRAPESVSFADAHALKQDLDDAIRWGADMGTRKRLERLTVGVRGELRRQMSVHEPYNIANDVYHRISDLWRTKAGKGLQRAARTDPDAIAAMLKPTRPAGALYVQDLLLTQAADGGDAAAGQQAWNGVRAAFTDRNLIRGGKGKRQGIGGLSARIAELEHASPDFAKIVYGDPDGQLVLGHLRQIGDAYTQAVARQMTERAAEKTAVAGANTAAKRTGEDALRAAVKDRTEFGRSSVAKYANAQPGGISVYQTVHPWLTLFQRVLSSPKGADLVTWASRAPGRTQWLVYAIQSPVWDRGNAAVIRGALSEMDGALLDPNASPMTTPVPPETR